MAAFALASVLCAIPPKRNKPTSPNASPTTVTLRGHVLAAIDSWTFGGALNWHYEPFIFGVESKGKGGKKLVEPVEIAYAFNPVSEGPLPESFFDHSKLYELQVDRTCGGDETVDDLAYMKFEDATTGNPLPSIKVLRLLDGAPVDLLKPDLVLPCYVLYSDGYRVIRGDKNLPRAPKSPGAKPESWTSL
jgi:hypothetical protein